MASTTTQTSIANRALQIVGYQSIQSLSQNDRGARAINRAYESVFLELLGAHPWKFATKRISLSASATAPAFGPARHFVLPGDFVALAPPDQISGITPGVGTMNGYNDLQVENAGGALVIATDQPSPLLVRYVSSDISPSVFHPCFVEALAASLALAICEELTQSNTKLQNIQGLLKTQIDLAKKRGAIESRPALPPVDSWLLARM